MTDQKTLVYPLSNGKVIRYGEEYEVIKDGAKMRKVLCIGFTWVKQPHGNPLVLQPDGQYLPHLPLFEFPHEHSSTILTCNDRGHLYHLNTSQHFGIIR